jgi:hypothetical protein
VQVHKSDDGEEESSEELAEVNEKKRQRDDGDDDGHVDKRARVSTSPHNLSMGGTSPVSQNERPTLLETVVDGPSCDTPHLAVQSSPRPGRTEGQKEPTSLASMYLGNFDKGTRTDFLEK